MKQFKHRISSDNPLVRDHRIDGCYVLPGVTYWDMCARCLGQETFSLRHIRYPNALIVPVDGHVEVYLDYDESQSTISIYHWQDQDKIVHFSAHYHPTPLRADPVFIDPDSDSQSVSMQTIYLSASKAGIQHGPFMQVTGNTSVDSSKIMMQIRLGQQGTSYLNRFYLHPALLDGATFGIAALHFGQVSQLEKDHLYLPLAIERVEVFRRIDQAELWVIAEKKPAPAGLISCDLLLCDANGKPYLRVSGLSNKCFHIRQLFDNHVYQSEIMVSNNNQSLEQKVLSVLSEFIEQPVLALSRKVSFFDLGFDSGQLMACSAKLEKILAISVYPTLLFEYNTVDKLLDYLAHSAQNHSTSSSTFLQEKQYALYHPSLVLFSSEESINQPISLLKRTNREQNIKISGPILDTSYFNNTDSIEEVIADLSQWLNPIKNEPFSVIIQISSAQQALFAALKALILSFNKESKALKLKLLMCDDVDQSIAACHVLSKESVFQYHNGQCYIPTQQAIESSDNSPGLQTGGSYLIVGGGDGLSKHLRTYLQNTYQAKIRVIGHRPSCQSCQVQNIPYQQVDVCDEQALQHYLQGKSFDGIFFLAAYKNDGLLIKAKKEDIQKVFSVKPLAFERLLKAITDEQVKFICAFSSLSAEIGQPGQTLYAAANSLLNHLAQQAERRRLSTAKGPRVFSVSWPYWQDGGMQLAPDLVAYFSQQYSTSPLETKQGMELLTQIIQQNHACVTVANEMLLGVKTNPVAIRSDVHLESPHPPKGHLLPMSGEKGKREETRLSELSDDDMAIIGLSFQLPDANTLFQLHHNLAAGQSSIKKVERPWSEQPYSWGGYLEGIDQFDPLFFNISPNEAKLMDPQERLFLSHAWHCLEDAGYTNKQGQAIGVIASAMFNSYQNIAINKELQSPKPQSILAAIANRVSYVCNLTGPSFTIDSMCSSALNALDLACQTLKTKPIDAMLVGAVNICSHPFKLSALVENKFLSPTGESKPFSMHANGYVPGEGVVVLMVKKAKQALSDGDSIYAVIKSIASTHGGHGQGFTVPSANAQASTIRQALTLAKLTEEDIDYVEAHGTSTALGDPIEMEGLHQVFSGRQRNLPVGSVKSNMGHLEPVAGFASLMKVIAQFHYRVIYPSIHAEPLNPKLMPSLGVLSVASRYQENVTFNHAGISCFGAGGSNTHCIVGNVQHNLIQREKTNYDLQSYWLEEEHQFSSVQWFHKALKPISALHEPKQAFTVLQPVSSVLPQYFSEASEKPSACLLSVTAMQCRNNQIESILTELISRHPSLQIILLTQEQHTWMMAHASIVSNVRLTQSQIKCIYLPQALSLPSHYMKTLMELEFENFDYRLVYYDQHMQRLTPVFDSLPLSGTPSHLAQQKIAVLGGLGELGMQFCLTLNALGISQYDVYGRSPASQKQSQLASLYPHVRYVEHDFLSSTYQTGSYDVIINCLGLMPGQADNTAARIKLKENYKRFVELAQPKKIITISSLSAWVGFGDEPAYAVDNASVLEFSNSNCEHVIVYCPLILTAALEAKTSREWFNWSQQNQGLALFSLDSFKGACSHILSLSGGEYLPFVGNEQTLKSYLQGRLQLPKEINFQSDKQTQTDPLLAMIEAILGIPSDKIDATKSFQELGFNSLTLASFAEKISTCFNKNFNPSRFFEIQNLNDLRDLLNVSPVAEITSSKDFSKSDDDPIVVCGHACQFADSENATIFWQNLVSGKECTQSTLQQRFGPVPETRIGLLEGIDLFDHPFFAISPQEAKWLDPQQRLLLQLSWHLFENAGIAPSSLKGEAVGVFIAIQFDDYARLSDREQSLDIYQITGCAKTFAANRLSYYYDFHGPSETIDTACSSSMSAIARAVQALRNEECDYALVMGVSLLCDFKTVELTEQLHIISQKGQCRPFDKDADGYVKGEGVAGILLTKRSIAEKRTLRTEAIVSGIAVNHGGRAQSITAPNGKAEQEVMRRAYVKSSVSPSEIDYLEAHATATKLGDPVEYQAITAVFGQGNRIGLGSVKANIGHTEPVSGLAGIIKALQMFAHQCIPQQINFTEINPYIELQAPFYIESNTVSKELRHIGVNCFGFGGSNGHCVLSHVQQQQPTYFLPYYLFVLSAHNQQALDELHQRWLTFVIKHPDIDRTALCKTLSLGRDHLPYRACWILDPNKDLLQQLQTQTCLSTTDSDNVSYQPFLNVETNELGNYLGKIASSYMNGKDIPWSTLYQGIECFPLILSEYPFAKYRHWIGNEMASYSKSEFNQPLECYKEEWQTCTLQTFRFTDHETILIIGYETHHALMTALVNQFPLSQVSLILIDEDYPIRLVHALQEKPQRIYYFGNLSRMSDNLLESQDNQLQKPLLHLLQSIQTSLKDMAIDLHVIASGVMQIRSETIYNAPAAAMYGLVQSFSKEINNCRCHCIAIADLDLLADAMKINGQDANLYYFDGYQLYIRQLVAVDLSPQKVNLENKIVVLLGGSGQVGQHLLPHLLAQQPAHCICISRTSTDLGEGVIHYAADCTDRVVFLETIEKIVERYHRIDYLIHLGSTYLETDIAALKYEDYLEQIRAKVWGTQYCLEASKLPQVQSILISSSAQVYSQNEKRGAYSAACYYSDALVQQFNSDKVNLLHWGFWQQKDEAMNQTMRSVGIHPINGQQGCDALLSVMTAVRANVSCFLVDAGMKAFMPITEESQQSLLQVIYFHQQLQQLEIYAADLIWSTLISCGVIFTQDRQPCLNHHHVLQSYHQYLQNLVEHLLKVANSHNHDLAALNDNQLLTRRWRQFKDTLDLEPFLNLLERCVSLLPKVLSGQLSPQQVLFPNGCEDLVRGVYQFNPLAQYYNRVVAKAVHEICDNNQRLPILEVGAGTGATTAEILVEGYLDLDYTFTDINFDFLEQAKQRFSKATNLHLQQFDINTDQAQNAYELIIASNVLHTCEDLPQTLIRLNQSLSLGGHLIINEAVASSLFLDATFGLFPQWHKQKQDGRINGSPLLGKEQWVACLEKAGFSVSFCDTPEWVEQVVIIACVTQKKAHLNEVQVKRVKLTETPKSPIRESKHFSSSLTDILAGALNISPESLQKNRSLQSYGLDSISAIHLTQTIKQIYGLDIQPTRLLQDEPIALFLKEFDLECSL
ncbi:KR domain-containing protein [Legionella sp. MW5194]|uniref:beta-ketoacyl synthase N-terminal-like domain-containing protein n=1 Tax=Legionella sp. MW5194 TaxID=2662448 RepID=UPI00193D2D01|nr:beta-ketoacyl synthase N-terminal-like domain-containing protein [Legionella sp. MW5194]QRN03530.1 KR domain-containing protein [Legionella sp. MW5194]